MRAFDRHTVLLPMLVLVAGCASGDMTSNRYAEHEQLAKPDRVIVYDFAATAADVPADAVIAGHYDQRTKPPTAKEIELGRQLGERVAAKLVEHLKAAGLPAERAGSGPPPKQDDVVVKGALVSVDEGSATRRMVIGFGAGAAELKSVVEVYQVTATGLRPLGVGDINAGGGHMPGLLVPVASGSAVAAAISGGLGLAREGSSESIEGAAERTATEISKVLEDAARKRGWIS